MRLKEYQQNVLEDLADFIEQVDKHRRLDTAFRCFWAERGVAIETAEPGNCLHPYDNSVRGIPNVTVKVPTAGGKTFIACNALRTIFDRMPLGKPQVVAWFVPSDTLLKQTYQRLSDSLHPYRQCLDRLFGGAVQVIDKEAALSGTGMKPDKIRGHLTILVLSVQSFASNNKEDRRVYRENERLAEYARLYDQQTKQVKGADKTSLIQVLSYLNPVTIIDESHNFEADLRVEMLNDLNPCFILDLTATPRKHSNIISFVDAAKLKQDNMVKLPVIVYNHQSTNDVIAKAVNLRCSLERQATRQEAAGGRYIRPIVLFQAQPNRDDDNITFDRIKQKLVEAGIPEEQIKIKTAQYDELKGLDLMSRDCPVRYIVTVNALKEGWDCPFAYILASLANKSSRIDVEQILGRVLRLPYTEQHRPELLNLSYVFTASNDFRHTVESIISSLNRAGFSKRDYRIPDTQETVPPAETTPRHHTPPSLFANDAGSNSDLTMEPDIIKAHIDANDETNDIKELERMAATVSAQYEDELRQARTDNIPSDLLSMIKRREIKVVFKEEAAQISLPRFVTRTKTSSLFSVKGEDVLIDKSMLSEGFDLSLADKDISFTRTEAEARLIDLDEQNEYVPVAKNIPEQEMKILLQQFNRIPTTEGKRKQLSQKIARSIQINEIAAPAIVQYIKDVLSRFDDAELSEMMAFEYETANAFKSKIRSQLALYREKKFNEMIDTGEIRCAMPYHFPEHINSRTSSQSAFKGLYTEEEGNMNDFEYRVINAVANLDNVRFWHRNPERSGFAINGFINHYPDFIVHLGSGRTVLIETKGDDRDNSNSRLKIALGQKWASKAGDMYRYFMVFNTLEVPGALKLTQLLERLQKM